MDDEKNDSPFELTYSTVEIGKTYPLFGMITKIVSEDPIILIINNQIKGTCNITDTEKLKLIKERAFESGIFITEITEFDPIENLYLGHIHTIIFGKKQEQIEN